MWDTEESNTTEKIPYMQTKVQLWYSLDEKKYEYIKPIDAV